MRPSRQDRGLLRDPRRGRHWHAPVRTVISPDLSATRLAPRLYSRRGPKAGLQPRRDVIEKRVILNDYLRRRGRAEHSGQWATTVGEIAAGVLRPMAALTARPWDARVGAGKPRGERHEPLRHHYATVIASLLDDLQALGILHWSGVKDNNGLWWRSRLGG